MVVWLWLLAIVFVMAAVGVGLRRSGLLFDSGVCLPPQNGAIAQYCPSSDTFAINEERLREDLDCGFCYFRRPTTPTGRQKQVVFGMMGDPDGMELERWIREQGGDPLDAYRLFVETHERAHQVLHRDLRLPSGYMHPKVLAMEAEANAWAYDKLGIKRRREVGIKRRRV